MKYESLPDSEWSGDYVMPQSMTSLHFPPGTRIISGDETGRGWCDVFSVPGTWRGNRAQMKLNLGLDLEITVATLII